MTPWQIGSGKKNLERILGLDQNLALKIIKKDRSDCYSQILYMLWTFFHVECQT